jgi:enediyne biosynthesis protein E4
VRLLLPPRRFALSAIVVLTSACGRSDRGLFHDVTASSGVDFRFRSDIVESKIVATMGGGSALGDFDNDGDLDLFLVNSVRKYGSRTNSGNCGRLYRNRGDGTFEDATPQSGILQCAWGCGAWWADLDNDGWLDLYVTNLGADELWHNARNGAFLRAGAGRFPDDPRYSIPAAFLDADRDGLLDVFVGNYVATSLEEESARGLREQKLPDEYEPPGNSFFRQRTDGTFADATDEAGLSDARGRTIGAIALDLGEDGITDLYLANDQMPNVLFRGRGDGTFEDVSIETGADRPPTGPTAFGGPSRSGMGLASTDFDRDGRPDLFITNFANEPNTLYRNVEGQLLENVEATTGLAAPSFPLSAWGCNFLDFDNDGWSDLFVSNGQILPRWVYWFLRAFSEKASRYNVGERTYRQRQHLFRNRGGTFEQVSPDVGGDLSRLVTSGRGSAAGDLDGDGRLDLVLAPVSDPARVFRNQTPNGGHWIELLPVADGDPRTPLHAKVSLRYGDRTVVEEFTIQPSYASGSYVPLHFGLGDATRIDSLEIKWPEGDVQILDPPSVDRAYRVSRRGLSVGLAGPK